MTHCPETGRIRNTVNGESHALQQPANNHILKLMRPTETLLACINLGLWEGLLIGHHYHCMLVCCTTGVAAGIQLWGVLSLFEPRKSV